MECCCYLRNVWQTGRRDMKDDLENDSKGQSCLFWSNGWISSCLTEISGKNSSIWQKKRVLSVFFAWPWAPKGAKISVEDFNWVRAGHRWRRAPRSGQYRMVWDVRTWAQRPRWGHYRSRVVPIIKKISIVLWPALGRKMKTIVSSTRVERQYVTMRHHEYPVSPQWEEEL